MTMIEVATPAQVALDLADALNERAHVAVYQLIRAIREIGPEAAYDLAARALFIQATGGLPLGAPWNRNRTPGGVFFYLLKLELDDEQHLRVFGRVRNAVDSVPMTSPEQAEVVPSQPATVQPKKAATPPKPPDRPCAACGEQADVVAKLHFTRTGKRCICAPCADLGFAFSASGEVLRLEEHAV
jgi:hypothetical protein